MSLQYSSYGAVLMLNIFIILILAIYSYNKRSSSLHTCFILLMASVFFWCFGSAMEFFSVEMEAKVFWIKISYIGVTTAAPLWLVFVLKYVKYDKYLKKSYLGLLFLIPLMVLTMALTNEWHWLLWPSITPASSVPGSFLIYEHGPVFWINILYSFAVVLTGIFILIKMLVNYSQKYRAQIYVILLSGLIPLIFSSLYTANIIKIPGLDITPFAFSISGILLVIGIFRLYFLDILPLAYNLLFKNMVNGFMIFDAKNKLIEVNSAAGLIGITDRDIGKHSGEVFSKFSKLEEAYESLQHESEIYLGDPLNRWIQVQITPIYDNNLFQGKLIIIQDINKRKNVEKELKKSLEEKDLMMKEIHHRVKNNLMIIQSLLKLQSKYIKDENALNIFRESQNRAKSMALIHQRLYQSGDLKKINFGNYTQDIVFNLFKSYTTNSNQIKLNVDVDNALLDVDTAIPLGLILNELVSNSLKHGFSEGRKGHLTVEFHLKDHEYRLIVSDDGTGIPEGLNYENADSLGLKLVYSLSDQIGAEVNLDTSRGTRFEIRFKDHY
ncbi:MAG: histidine kinase N-terminal 7TM domain-containing protein [Methanobacterium sp.]